MTPWDDLNRGCSQFDIARALAAPIEPAEPDPQAGWPRRARAGPLSGSSTGYAGAALNRLIVKMTVTWRSV